MPLRCHWADSPLSRSIFLRLPYICRCFAPLFNGLPLFADSAHGGQTGFFMAFVAILPVAAGVDAYPHTPCLTLFFSLARLQFSTSPNAVFFHNLRYILALWTRFWRLVSTSPQHPSPRFYASAVPPFCRSVGQRIWCVGDFQNDLACVWRGGFVSSPFSAFRVNGSLPVCRRVPRSVYCATPLLRVLPLCPAGRRNGHLAPGGLPTPASRTGYSCLSGVCHHPAGCFL